MKSADGVKLTSGRILAQGFGVAIKTVSKKYHVADEETGHKQKMSKEEIDSLYTECEIGMMVDHPGLVKMFSVHLCSSNMHIVQELMEGGELFDRILDRYAESYFTEKECARMLKQLGEALAYLHDMGIAHRDLKVSAGASRSARTTSSLNFIL